MFNFFKEIIGKADNKLLLSGFNIVNVSGKLLYLEGHNGLQELAKDRIILRVKGGVVQVLGEGLSLAELSENTVKIVGKICRVEHLEKI